MRTYFPLSHVCLTHAQPDAQDRARGGAPGLGVRLYYVDVVGDGK
jgi:hypothetical protein